MKLLLSFTAFALCLATAAHAQQLQGVVTDPSGAAVAKATVSIAQPPKTVATTTTSLSGRFSFQNIPDGTYVVTAQAPGFSMLHQSVTIAGGSETMTLRLAVAAAESHVEVTADNIVTEPEATASKLGLPILDAPVSLETVTRKTIDDRAVVDLDQVVDTVSGIQRAPGFPFQTGYFIRGFFDSYDTLHDGFRDYTGSADVSNIDHVEVLKGSPSVDYGTVATGGLLNVVTKSPFAGRFGSAQFDAASFDLYRTTVDLNSPLHGDTLLGRINLAYRNAGSFRDFQRDDNYFVAPAILWKPTSSDTLALKGEFNHQDFIFPSDFPYYQIFTTLPIEESISEPHVGGSRSNIYREELDYRHSFRGNWQVREGFAATSQYIRVGRERVYSTSLEADGITLDRTVSSGPQNSENYTLQQELFGRFHVLGFQNQIAVGVEGYRERYNYINNFASLAPLNLLNPVYGSKPGTPTPGYNGSYGSDDVGVYTQDYVALARRWHLLAAVRYDRNDTLSINYIGQTRSDVHSHKYSPRLALTYQPLAQTTIYFDWSRSFLPNFGTNATNQAFQPVLGEQYEVGAKRGFLNQHVLGTLSLYQITKQNVLTPDLNSPQFSIATGEQRSRGIEATAQGEVLSGLDTTISYAYTDASVTRDNSIPIGSFLANVPRNQTSFWATYRLPFASVRGVGVGFGGHLRRTPPSLRTGDLCAQRIQPN